MSFGGLEIGKRGLAAAQMSMNVAGQNVSNANTDGYSRKRVDTSVASRRDTALGEVAYGVNIDRVIRYADQFLEQQIREQVTEKSYYQEINKALERVENIFNEPSDDGLSYAMDQFWNAWQDLANNPEDVASREVVKSTALVMADVFHTLASKLEDLRASQDTIIEDQLKLVNGLTKEIFNLNNEVSITEIGGGEANDSRDRRDHLVQELSEIMDVAVVEDELGRYTITTAGSVLIGPSINIELELQRKSTLQDDGKRASEVTIRFADTKRDYVPRDGVLDALFDIRDSLIPKYQGFMDELAKEMVQTVNSIHETGYNLKRTTGIQFFDPEKLSAGSISLSSSISKDAQNVAAAKGGVRVGVGPLIPAPVIPAQLNPVLNLTAIDPNYRDITQGSMQIRWNSQILKEGAGQDYIVDYEFGNITFLNYARFAAGDAVDINFDYNNSGFPGTGNGDNALKISNLRYDLTLGNDGIGNPTLSIGEFYASFISVLGIEKNQAQTRVNTREILLDQFINRKAEVSGVSLDEELANMIKFEHSYQATARYISIVNSMLDTLINI